MFSSSKGFALLQVTILAMILAIGLAAMFRYAETLGFTAMTYDTVDSLEAANRSAAKAAAELVEQIVIDNATPQGQMLADADFAAHDLYPSAAAAWDDDVVGSPDLIIRHGRLTSYVDVDYVPLTAGFSWTSIKFGSAYQEAAAGNASAGALTYRIRVMTTHGDKQKLETEAVYIVNR